VGSPAIIFSFGLTDGQALHDAGTLACHVQTLQAKKHELEDEVAASPDKIQYLVTKFLDGVLEEAGRMIGTGDPLNYRRLVKDNRNCLVSDHFLNFSLLSTD